MVALSNSSPESLYYFMVCHAAHILVEQQRFSPSRMNLANFISHPAAAQTNDGSFLFLSCGKPCDTD